MIRTNLAGLVIAMRNRALLITFAFIIGTPALADFRDGYYAHDRGDYATAKREFQRLAEGGSANAQYLLGVMHEKGQGGPKDYELAYRWYVEAAYQGQVQAQNNLGALYDEGRGVKQNYPAAALWYQLAAEGGSAKAQFNLAEMYMHGRGVRIDHDKALYLYYEAASQGHKKSKASVPQLSQTDMSNRAKNAGPPEKETSLDSESRTDFEKSVYGCTKQVQAITPSRQFVAYAEGSRVRHLGPPDSHSSFERCMSMQGHPLADK